MQTVTRHFDTPPSEFFLHRASSGRIFQAEWREPPDEDGNTVCHYVIADAPADYDAAVALLAACRYTAPEEVALMRRPAADADLVEHEAYIARAKGYARSLFAGEREEA